MYVFWALQNPQKILSRRQKKSTENYKNLKNIEPESGVQYDDAPNVNSQDLCEVFVSMYVYLCVFVLCACMCGSGKYV